MVGGNWVVEDGRIPGLDIEQLIGRHSAAARRLQKLNRSFVLIANAALGLGQDNDKKTKKEDKN